VTIAKRTALVVAWQFAQSLPDLTALLEKLPRLRLPRPRKGADIWERATYECLRHDFELHRSDARAQLAAVWVNQLVWYSAYVYSELAMGCKTLLAAGKRYRSKPLQEELRSAVARAALRTMTALRELAC
jgi:hypothetical protein